MVEKQSKNMGTILDLNRDIIYDSVSVIAVHPTDKMFSFCINLTTSLDPIRGGGSWSPVLHSYANGNIQISKFHV